MGWTMGVLAFDSRRGLRVFPLHHRVQNGSGAHPASIQWVAGVLAPGIKRPPVKLTTYLHLVPRSKNEWSYTSTPQYPFMAWCLVKHRDNFTFTETVCKGLDWTNNENGSEPSITIKEE
jgi:hypothetical protein